MLHQKRRARLSPAGVLLAALLALPSSARASDLVTTIPRAEFDNFLQVLGPVGGSGTWYMPFGKPVCRINGPCRYPMTLVGWNWNVRSPHVVVSGSAASLEFDVQTRTLGFSRSQHVSIPLTALYNGATARLELVPQARTVAVVFPSVAGDTTVATVDVSTPFAMGTSAGVAPFTLFGRTLTPSLTNLTTSWSADALVLSADLVVH